MAPSGLRANGMGDCGRPRSGMKRPKIAALLAALLFLVVAAAVAQFKPASPQPSAPQQPPQQPQSETPPLFSTNVNLVRLLVSVRNSNGELITNLEKQDFRLLDSGV